MAAPPIPPIRLGLIGTGLAVEKLHWPALRGLADRYVVTAFTDVSAVQGRRFADCSGVGPALAAADRAALPARDALAAGKDVFCEKPTGVDAEQAAAFLALAAGHPDRTFVVDENSFYRDDLPHSRALLDAGAIGRLHLMAWRHAGRLVPREGWFTGTPWRQRPRYRGRVHLDVGVHRIARIRLLCGDIARCAVPCRRPTARSPHRRTSRSTSSSPEAPSATTPRPTPRSRCRQSPTTCGCTAPRACSCSPDPPRSAA